jgi:hypothetical protein
VVFSRLRTHNLKINLRKYYLESKTSAT